MGIKHPASKDMLQRLSKKFLSISLG